MSQHLLGHLYGGTVPSLVGSYSANSLESDLGTGGSTSPGSCSHPIGRRGL
ncbi:UNVERIFIED_CONTAM: hypothetical protein Sangu_2623400 [Sesamum angustifolium]|uniref:Uncharacterized protein n=1 Tax=Sesamum angustifolium TaxID=2727405 RepID=A0AAW2J5A4_9LAMI